MYERNINDYLLEQKFSKCIYIKDGGLLIKGFNSDFIQTLTFKFLEDLIVLYVNLPEDKIKQEYIMINGPFNGKDLIKNDVLKEKIVKGTNKVYFDCIEMPFTKDQYYIQ